ncbi:MAG: polar amino acid transport system substrate-binding protein [Candidatus Binatota bacterium]|jgi:polar amino acid transport system substrate-binding protein|nr:polar amino acid transport system substrate-binding protein [Candidatus Binatota bacterium]
MITPSLHSDLAPTGKLRVGINYGNAILATKDPVTGEPAGVAPDLARELGKRTGLPIEFVTFEAAGKMFEAVKSGAWDVAFLAIDPMRAGEIDYTAPYIEIEGTYLVPSGAPYASPEEVDRAAVRIGVSANSAYDLFLRRALKHAELVHAGSPAEAFELLASGATDVLAGVRQHLAVNSERLPGSRVLDEPFMTIRQAMGIVKGRGDSVAYLRGFIEDAKASGLVARSLEKSAVTGVSIAPKA